MWCLFYTILHKSVVIQDNSIDVPFNGLLAHHLDKLYQYHKCLHRGGWLGMVGSHGSGRLNTRQVVTLPNGPICALDTNKINGWITSQLCGNLQPGGFSLTASRVKQSEHSWTSDMPQKAATAKAD